jgi:hypothetical protein
MLSHRAASFGTTMLETVFAFFFIAGTFATVAGLYASTFVGQGADRLAAQVVTAAESRLDELKAQAHDPTGFVNLESQAGTITVDPGLTVVTEVETVERRYPCEGLFQNTTFTGTYKTVTVTVSPPGGKALSVSTVVGDPPRPVSQLRVARLGAEEELKPGEDVIFEVALLDSEGRTIPDIQFDFYINLGSGNAELEVLPGGNQVRLTNEFQTESGDTVNTGGEVSLVARAFYAGQEHFGESDPLVLEVP